RQFHRRRALEEPASRAGQDVTDRWSIRPILRARGIALLFVASLCLPLSASPGALQDPALQKWEMIVHVTADGGTSHKEAVTGGSDEITETSHSEEQVTAIFDAMPLRGGVQIARMISMAGGGSSSGASERHFKRVTGGNGSPVHTETIDES